MLITDWYCFLSMTAMVAANSLIIYQQETDKKTNENPVMQEIIKKPNS
ncbi:MAG: hypothetical protein KAH18_11870 [Psychromonas sp.]|nr:hypothetical protein [Psychromonas sp.]